MSFNKTCKTVPSYPISTALPRRKGKVRIMVKNRRGKAWGGKGGMMVVQCGGAREERGESTV